MTEGRCIGVEAEEDKTPSAVACNALNRNKIFEKNRFKLQKRHSNLKNENSYANPNRFTGFFSLLMGDYSLPLSFFFRCVEFPESSVKCVKRIF